MKKWMRANSPRSPQPESTARLHPPFIGPRYLKSFLINHFGFAFFLVSFHTNCSAQICIQSPRQRCCHSHSPGRWHDFRFCFFRGPLSVIRFRVIESETRSKWKAIAICVESGLVSVTSQRRSFQFQSRFAFFSFPMSLMFCSCRCNWAY